jgi:branched-chain amino acid transport system substrate-binding protein
MLRRRALTFVGAAVAASIYPFSRAVSKTSASAFTLTAILPLTGNLAVIGTPKREAMELALEQVSKLYPNLNLKIQYHDSQANVGTAISILNQVLVTNTPDCLFIDMTPIVDATIPIVNYKKILTFAGSAQAGITTRSQHLFRVFPGGDQEVNLIGDYLNPKRVNGIFLIHANEQYGRSIRDALLAKKLGIPVLGAEEFGIVDRDFRTQLTKARQSGAQAIALFGYGNEYSTLLKQAQELGIPASTFVANIGAVNVGVSQLPPDLIEGMVFAAPAFALRSGSSSASPEQVQLESAYKSKYAKTADFRVAFIYDTIMLLAQELNRGQRGDSLRLALQRIESYRGASGTITISNTRDARAELVLATYRGGKPTQMPLTTR